jgi:hypothetical protein
MRPASDDIAAGSGYSAVVQRVWAPMTWFGFFRHTRCFSFEAMATDGFLQEFEIEARTAKAACDRAKRLCAARGWMLARQGEADIQGSINRPAQSDGSRLPTKSTPR